MDNFMNRDFIVFHTNLICFDKDLKDFSKLLYISFIHVYDNYYIEDCGLIDRFTELFGVSKRSLYRAFRDLIFHDYIKRYNKVYWQIIDKRLVYEG